MIPIYILTPSFHTSLISTPSLFFNPMFVSEPVRIEACRADNRIEVPLVIFTLEPDSTLRKCSDGVLVQVNNLDVVLIQDVVLVMLERRPLRGEVIRRPVRCHEPLFLR